LEPRSAAHDYDHRGRVLSRDVAASEELMIGSLRWPLRMVVFASLVLGAAGIGGCRSQGQGDPCFPEAISDDGFHREEGYVESGSTQCRTRTCLVYHLEGDPRTITGTSSCEPSDMHCVTEAEVDARIFCSCRCSGGPPNTPHCACAEGFVCEHDLVREPAGQGVRGGYCVRRELADEPDR
jgi:hypothetical protein